MTAGTTYTSIASTVLTSLTGTVTFSNISASYTDLVLICDAAISSGSANYELVFNSDVSANYSYSGMIGNGSTVTGGEAYNTYFIRCDYGGSLTTAFGSGININIGNYSNTSVRKTTISRSGGTGGVGGTVGTWHSTAAISTIKIQATGGTFISGSTFSLYGIVRA